MRSRPCRQVKRTEVAVRRNSIGCCFDPAIWEKVFAFGERRAASFIQFMQQEFVRQYRPSGSREQGAVGEEREEWEGDWEDERAPNECYESAAVDYVVDSDRCQDANGGSATCSRQLSFTAWETWRDGGGWTPVIKEEEQGKIGTKKK